jgi:hypothetical protein
MTDGGVAFQPGADEVSVSFRPRGDYVGYRAFGDGDGAVLVKPEVAHDLRSAAEFATQEGRVAGGLLYGRGWVDDQGAYLVVNGYLEAGPGENRGDRIAGDGSDEFTLSRADLRLLRQDAARMYSAVLEVGWWRTLAALGEFGPGDFETQAGLVGPDGVGLLVYGSGPHWGTAYLGPDGLAPDSAGTLVTVVESEPLPDPEPAPHVVDLGAGETLEQEPLPDGPVPPAPAPRRLRPRVPSRVRVPTRLRAARPPDPEYSAAGPELPGDVRFVVGALIVVTVIAAFIVGVLVSSAIVAVIIAVVGLLAILSTVWMSHRY